MAVSILSLKKIMEKWFWKTFVKELSGDMKQKQKKKPEQIFTKVNTRQLPA